MKEVNAKNLRALASQVVQHSGDTVLVSIKGITSHFAGALYVVRCEAPADPESPQQPKGEDDAP